MNRREFSAKTRVAAFQRCGGNCESCGVRLTVGKFHYDHVIADGLGGEPTIENCAVLCHPCHGKKTAKRDQPLIAKVKRVHARHIGARAPSPRGLRKPPGTRFNWRTKRYERTDEANQS